MSSPAVVRRAHTTTLWSETQCPNCNPTRVQWAPVAPPRSSTPTAVADVVAFSKPSAVHRMSTPTQNRSTLFTSDAMYSPNLLPAETTPALPQVVTTASAVPRLARSVSHTLSSQLNTDDEGGYDDDTTTLDRSRQSKDAIGKYEEEQRAADRICGITDSLCGFGGDATQSRQVPLRSVPYERRIRELRTRNQKLHRQNQRLHQQNAQMNQMIRLTSTTSDRTVLTFKQRCQIAEYKNLQYEKEIALLKQRSNIQTQENNIPSGLKSTNGSAGDEITAASLKQRDDSIVELSQQPITLQQKLANISTNSNPTQFLAMETTPSQIGFWPQELQDLKYQYEQKILELETANQQLELDVRDAVDLMEHKTEYYCDTIRALENKHCLMERQVLKTKLQLAAANETNEQSVEDHQMTIDTLREENVKLLNDLSEVINDRELLKNDKEQLIAELKRSLAAAYEAKELVMMEHQTAIQLIEQSRLLLVQELSGIKLELEQFFGSEGDEKKSDFDCADTQLPSELHHSLRTIEELCRVLARVEILFNDCSLPGDDDKYPIVDPAMTDLLHQEVDDLNTKVKKLKKKLVVAKNENSRFRAQLILKAKNTVDLKSDHSMDTEETVDVEDESTMSETSARRLLKERDDAISSLVKQAVGQDKLIAELRSEIEILNSIIASKNGTSDIDLVQQLQKEAEVFASQVIEVDAEIEHLKSKIIEHKFRVAELEQQLEDAKTISSQRSLPVESETSWSTKVHDLEAEIDELKEANSTQQEELRNLRRKVWNTAAFDDEIATARNEMLAAKREVSDHLITIELLGKEKVALTDALSAERSIKAELEQQLKNEVKASPGHMSEEDVVLLRDEMETLRQNHIRQIEELRTARSTIQELEEILANQNAKCAAGCEEEKEELLAEIESLTHHLDEAKEKIREFEADVEVIADFKDKLERADEAREASEKNIVDTFERRISLLALDKDVTIDKLRKELMIEKQSKTEEMEEVVTQLKRYQVEISELREEMAEQVEHREVRIYELEATLTAQEQLVSTMKTEMDHLQSSMEGSVARRKDENDEMQQELLTLTAAAGKQDREITYLKVELEAKTLEYQSVIAKLEHKVAVLERTPSELRNAQDLQMELRVKEVKDRLEKLKWRNTSLKEENLNLRERLEQAELLAKANSDSDRVLELEEQLSKQLLKVKNLETELRSAREPPVDEPVPSSSSTGESSNAGATSGQMTTDLKDAAPSRSTKPPILTRAASPHPVRSVPVGTKERKFSTTSPLRGLKLFGRK